MREILFRGKRTDNGEWFYGYYTNARYYLDKKEMHIIFEQDVEVYPHSEFAGGEEVIPETVGQYTGLTDKNGRKIFEGDIVRYGDTIHRVVFEQRNGTAYFGIVISDIETWLFGNECPANLMDVVGNIYDNTELLKGGIENG